MAVEWPDARPKPEDTEIIPTERVSVLVPSSGWSIFVPVMAPGAVRRDGGRNKMMVWRVAGTGFIITATRWPLSSVASERRQTPQAAIAPSSGKYHLISNKMQDEPE